MYFYCILDLQSEEEKVCCETLCYEFSCKSFVVIIHLFKHQGWILQNIYYANKYYFHFNILTYRPFQG